jgi:hypothetical protein
MGEESQICLPRYNLPMLAHRRGSRRGVMGNSGCGRAGARRGIDRDRWDQGVYATVLAVATNTAIGRGTCERKGFGRDARGFWIVGRSSARRRGVFKPLHAILQGQWQQRRTTTGGSSALLIRMAESKIRLIHVWQAGESRVCQGAGRRENDFAIGIKSDEAPISFPPVGNAWLRKDAVCFVGSAAARGLPDDTRSRGVLRRFAQVLNEDLRVTFGRWFLILATDPRVRGEAQAA